MAKVRVKWTDAQAGEDGVRIYRDSAPIDPEALPSPIAELRPGVGMFEDGEASVGTQHYYIAPFADTEVGPGTAASVEAVEELPRFVIGTQLKGVASGTTLDVPIPDCREGDLLIIYGLRRAALGTIPTGWTAGPVPANDGDAGRTDQWTFCMWKTADGTEPGTSVTVTQTSAGRLQAGVAVIRHPKGPITVTSLGTARFNETTWTNPIGFTNGASKALVMSIASWVFANTTTENILSGYSARMQPVAVSRMWGGEPYSTPMRTFAWFTEADAAEVFSSAVTCNVANASDSRSDIHLALTV